MTDLSFTTRRTAVDAVPVSDDLPAEAPFVLGSDHVVAPDAEQAEPDPSPEVERGTDATAGVDAQADTAEEHTEPEPNPAAQDPEAIRTRTLVVSETPGIAEMVARGLARDATLEVSHRRLSLSALTEAPEIDLTALDLVVFEVRPGTDADTDALHALRDASGDRIKFLGVTSEALTLSTAKALMEAGVAEVMPLGNAHLGTAESDRNSEETAHANARSGDEVRNGMILAVTAARGGIGATAFALNLATVLARPATADDQAKSVAVIDLDFQNGVLGASIDIQDTGAYLEMLRGDTLPDRGFLRRAMVRHEACGFDVMAAPVTFAPLDALTPEKLTALLEALRLDYDYIVLDLPRALVDWLDPILSRADRMFILGDTTVHTVRQMRRMTDLYLDDHASLPVELVVSMEKKPFSPSANVKEAERFLDRKLSHWLPFDAGTARKAADQGLPMLYVRPGCAVAKAMAPMIRAIRADFASNARRRA